MKYTKIVNGVEREMTEAEVENHLAFQAELKIQAVECCRKEMYGDVGAQLGMIFDELKEKGSLSVDGPWFQHIQSVKDMNPKGDV